MILFFGKNKEINICGMTSSGNNVSVCPSPRRPYKGSVTVTEEDGVKVARLICPLGYMLSDPTLQMFICGANTTYIWFPVVEVKNVPKCTDKYIYDYYKVLFWAASVFFFFFLCLRALYL